MSKNVLYILIGLVVVALLGMFLQTIVINSLKPSDDSVVVPDTHRKFDKVIKGVRPGQHGSVR